MMKETTVETEDKIHTDLDNSWKIIIFESL